jgi:hypothetical protein
VTIYAKVIADSVSAQGIRLTTMQITLHRYVLSEFNTHRMFSRNFRSSRAVPVKKLLEEVRTNPAMPVAWLKNKPGMQATEPMTQEEEANARGFWMKGARHAAGIAELLSVTGLHKQWANRGLEPYLYVHGVVTATDYANFYALRRHEDAQPEMKVLADAMWEAQEGSTPELLQPGQWHLPYITAADYADTQTDWDEMLATGDDGLSKRVKVSVARCARVSYLTHDNRSPSVAEDLKLYDRLVGSTPLHASPAEHQATPDTAWWGAADLGWDWKNPHLHGNLNGWISHRKTLPNECVRS